MSLHIHMDSVILYGKDDDDGTYLSAFNHDL